jgi:hypothetical protein
VHTSAHVATLGLGDVLLASTEARVNNLGLAQDQTVANQLADVGAWQREREEGVEMDVSIRKGGFKEKEGSEQRRMKRSNSFDQ